MTCEQCQAQLLEHLYGLLEPAEAQVLADHLRGCGGCQAALARAEGQQRLLAAAARSEFAGVRFEAPRSAVTAAPPPPAPVLKLPARRSWAPWVAAAAVLLVALGLGAPSGLYWQQQSRVATAKELVEEKASFVRNLQMLEQEAAAWAPRNRSMAERGKEDARRKYEQAVAQIRAKPLRLIVHGPEVPQAGAPNEYQIETRNLEYQPVAAKVAVRVLGPNQQVVYETNDIKGKDPGRYKVVLPRDLPLKANAELTLEVSARSGNGPAGQLSERLTLGGPLYLTHLTTDKPMYQPGETVHFRSLTLERFRLTPPDDNLHLSYMLTKPNGQQVPVLTGAALLTTDAANPDRATVRGPDGKPVKGVGAGSIVLEAATFPGGEYTLTVSEASNRFQPQVRKFLVNQYQKPQLNKELEFTRKSYGPGDEVVAACKVSRAEGGTKVANQPAMAKVVVDGKIYGPDGKEARGEFALRTDAQGGVNVKFKLPPAIVKGDATLSVTFIEGRAVTETMVRPIPLVLKRLNVEFFPEGGDLVEGLANRVYFQARTTLDKPAEVKGRIVDGQGKTVTEAVTMNDPTQPGANQGMGAFSFTPVAGQTYELKIDAPSGVEGRTLLPAAKKEGVVLNVASGVVGDKESLRGVVRSGDKDRTLLVGAYCRGRLMAHERVTVKKGAAEEFELKPEDGVGGVYRVTVFEEQGGGARPILTPVAERLTYRAPARRLKLSVQPDKNAYVPGDKVTLTATATDEDGKPAPAVLFVAVADKSVVTLADEKSFRTLPTHFLLTNEVRKPEDLEHSDFLLTDHPKAPLALDLLLGTQGWRRFAEQNPDIFRQKHLQDAERLLVLNGQISPAMAPKSFDLDAQEIDKLGRNYQEELVVLEGRARDAEAAAVNLSNPARGAQMQRAQADLEDSRSGLEAEVATLNRQRELAKSYGPGALLGLSALLLVLSIVTLMAGLARRTKPAAIPFFVTAACCVLMFGFVFTFSNFDLTAEDVSNVAVNMPSRPSMGLPGAPADRFGNPQGIAVPPRPAMEKADAAPADAAKPAPPAPMAVRPGADEKAAAADMDGAADGKKDFARLRNAGRQFDPGRMPPAAAKAEAFMRGRPADAKKNKEAVGEEKQRLMQRRGAGIPQAEAGQARGPARDMRMGGGGGMPGGGFGGLQGNRAGAGGAEFRKVPPPGFGGDVAMQEVPAAPPPPAPLVIREYVHVRTSQGQERTDWTETLFWHPVLVLPEDGKTTVSFQLCDSVTSFQVLAAGHTLDGRLGSVTTVLESRKPLSLEPKLPIEVTAGDKIDVPLSLTNNSDAERTVTVRVSPRNFTLTDSKPEDRVTLPANGRARRVYRLTPSVVEGEASVAASAGQDGAADDEIRRTVKVVPEGFPVVVSQSDLLEKAARNEVVLPDSWIPGTLKCRVSVYPSTLADLQKGLEALLREPNGCFEQISTSNYPNLLILDYLKESDQANPDLARRASQLLADGYQKLTSFECLDQQANRKQGYEWFGGVSPAHEALTAYGLMQFRDMTRVFDVDKSMLERTRNYLMASRDGQGGFKRNPRTLDTFGRAPEDITNAYIVWALTEGGKEDDVAKELNSLANKAKTSKDPYFLALVANSLINRDRAADAAAVLKTLIELQKEDGHLDAAVTSITGSGGRDLQIETTALAALAWLKANRPGDYNLPTQKAVRWLGQQRGGYGGFGSTQSTILTLKALIAYTRANKKTAEAGEVTLLAGGKVLKKAFAAGAEDAIVLDLEQPDKLLKPGKNAVAVEITGKNAFPYTLSWSYNTLKPVSNDKCPVALTTRLDRDKAAEGETVSLNVTVENKTAKGQAMTVAVVGLPAGLTLPEDMKQLKDYARLQDNGTKEGRISAFEIRGRELVLYWRDMAPGKKVEVPVELICRVPGEYRGPASRAYLYYNADHKCWVEPLKVTITSRAAE